eukprot:scaffold24310_cov113-Isochrysis_galbana.AAC.1
MVTPAGLLPRAPHQLLTVSSGLHPSLWGTYSQPRGLSSPLSHQLWESVHEHNRAQADQAAGAVVLDGVQAGAVGRLEEDVAQPSQVRQAAALRRQASRHQCEPAPARRAEGGYDDACAGRRQEPDGEFESHCNQAR